MLEMKKIYVTISLKNSTSFSMNNINYNLYGSNELLILNGSVKLINNIVVLSDLKGKMSLLIRKSLIKYMLHKTYLMTLIMIRFQKKDTCR